VDSVSGGIVIWGLECYLDFDKFLDTVHNDKVLDALRGFPNNDLIACSHPATVTMINERLRCGLCIVKVSEHHSRTLDVKLAWGAVFRDFLSFDVDKFCFQTSEECSRRTGINVKFTC
jgi:hypothetical protein